MKNKIINILLPNEIIETIYNINVKNLNYKKIKYIFFDFDNTLMPWDSDNISDKVLEFLIKLKDNNKKIIIASNGKNVRIKKIKNQLPKSFDVLHGLGKPKTTKLRKYIEFNKIDLKKSVFIGDNLITDIYTANKIGMFTIKVKPIAFKEFWATKIYRIIELIVYVIYSKKFKEIYEKSTSNRGEKGVYKLEEKN